mmetsp:Transcript_13412/g.32296  ORF Transcript_13412/g.32296 Transcript_13412/m.32296 type:complete len:278 (-) Transcript_13412:863-1696(-)
MVAMTVNAQTSGSRCQGSGQNVSCRILLFVFLLLGCSLFFINGAKFHNLLDRSGAMKIQTGIHQASADALDEHDALFRSNLLKDLLKEVVSKGIHHGLTPKGESFVQDHSGSHGTFFVQSLLHKTATNLVTRETSDLTQQRVKRRTLRSRVQRGCSSIGLVIGSRSVLVAVGKSVEVVVSPIAAVLLVTSTTIVTLVSRVHSIVAPNGIHICILASLLHHHLRNHHHRSLTFHHSALDRRHASLSRNHLIEWFARKLDHLNRLKNLTSPIRCRNSHV